MRCGPRMPVPPSVRNPSLRRPSKRINARRTKLHPCNIARRTARAPLDEPRGAATILKSGVVDGMAYTLYTDGSIEAKLPDGTVRFGSIAELRAHIERNS